MKRIKLSILIVLCLLIFCSCSDIKGKELNEPNVETSDQISETSQIEPVIGGVEQKGGKYLAISSEVVKKIKEILIEDTPFFDVGLAEKINIKELSRVVSSDESIAVAISNFTVIDLDEDGIDEIVLWLAVDEKEDFGCEILHYANDEVYGFFIPYRGFNSLKADGTFSFSSGAGNSGIGKIKFDLQEYVVEKITFSETRYDTLNQAEVCFVVNGHESSYADFEKEIEKQSEKKDAEMYSFTNNNVEKYIY